MTHQAHLLQYIVLQLVEVRIRAGASEADRWKICDAINANAWAFRWAGYIADHVACRWTD